MTTTTRTVTPGTPKDPSQSGTIFVRKPKGRKYTFIIGGPSYEDAHKFINWQGVAEMGNLVFWAGEEGLFQVTEQKS